MRTAILCTAALAVAGCGGDPKPLPVAGTPDSCRDALVAALGGWKEGRNYQELAEGSPPVQLRDDDFNGGAKLIDYKIEGDGQQRGTGHSFAVTLTLQTQGAKGPVKKKVYYNSVSEPSRAVFREDRKP